MGNRYSRKVKLWLIKENWEMGWYRTRGSTAYFVFFFFIKQHTCEINESGNLMYKTRAVV